MFQLSKYLQPDTAEEAYELLQASKGNVILGGTTFLRLSSKKYATGIDLSRLNLDEILHKDHSYELGAYVTYGDIIRHEAFSIYADGILPKALSSIVGTQFRNQATVGAGVFSRYGFSDFLPVLLVLDAKVHLQGQGVLPVKDFLTRPHERDLCLKVTFKDTPLRGAYEGYRSSRTDFPLVNVAVSLGERGRIAFGARPQRAMIAEEASRILTEEGFSEETFPKIRKAVLEEVPFGANARGGKEYREKLAVNLLYRALKSLEV